MNRFDKRWLEWTGDPNQIPTKDKKYIWVDTFARWRIADPLRFFQRMRDERTAQSRLDDIIDGETRNAIASYNLIEAVRTSNRAFEDEEYAETTPSCSEARGEGRAWAATSSPGASSSGPRRWSPSSASSSSTCRSSASTTWTRCR